MAVLDIAFAHGWVKGAIECGRTFGLLVLLYHAKRETDK